MFLQLGLILGSKQLICRMNSLPFSPAGLSAAGTERKLHHHPLLVSISVSPGIAAALLGDGVASEGPFHFIFLAIKKGNLKNVCISTGLKIVFIFF